jgi:PKD repeat protein
MKWAARIRAILLAGCAAWPAAGAALAQDKPTPLLVTFGPEAPVNEGDHDFRQLIRFSVPAETGRVDVRVFDPDTGGAFDEQGGAVTVTRFSLFGAGAAAKLGRDAEGVVQESVEGAALDSKEFARDSAIDGQWSTLFSVDAGQGVEEADGRRSFALSVEGVSGNGGNVFDVAVMRADTQEALEGVKLYTFMPTFQVPRGNLLAEFALDVPAGVKALTVENFDSAGGSIAFAGKFRSVPLTASAKSQWQSDEVGLAADEPGSTVSLTAAKGRESPNDMTVFVGEAGGDAADRPVAINLPLRALPPSRRPEIALKVTPRACSQMHFDAAGSRDPDGGALSYRWVFDGSSEPAADSATLEKSFPTTGTHSGRLEVFDASGMIGNGTAQDFSFFVKAPPVARFAAPELVAEGATFALDGTASSSPTVPDVDNPIASYRWSLGDGTVVEQRRGEAGFGKLEHRYAAHGTYTVTLTVTDSAQNPCNTATATRTVTVNAPPVANAGGDRVLVAGEIASFDAGLSRDPDGSIVSYLWEFGDGSQATGSAVRHTFHQPGNYSVWLTTTDDSPFASGQDTDTIVVSVRPADNQRPTAQAGADRTIMVGQPVRFDGRKSADPGGRILRYQWDFGDGDGSDLPVVDHAYWRPGTYPVTLAIGDDGGSGGAIAIDTAMITVVPAANSAPAATLPKEFSATTFRPLRFDASAAKDSDGAIISYEWDFGDGGKGTGPMVEHLYGKPGTYNGRLVLTDNALPTPAKVAFDFTVMVADRPDQAPVASAGKDLTAAAGTSVPLDASASADADGSLLSYRWDLGDGNRTSGINPRHVYQLPGSYKIKLTVEDDGPREKLSAGHEIAATITEVPNIAPIARASGPAAAKTAEIVRFDGTASGDADGNVLAYRWEFGDGGASSAARPFHTFHDAGTYRVRLTVVDDNGLASSAAEIEMKVEAAADSGGQP